MRLRGDDFVSYTLRTEPDRCGFRPAEEGGLNCKQPLVRRGGQYRTGLCEDCDIRHSVAVFVRFAACKKCPQAASGCRVILRNARLPSAITRQAAAKRNASLSLLLGAIPACAVTSTPTTESAMPSVILSSPASKRRPADTLRRGKRRPRARIPAATTRLKELPCTLSPHSKANTSPGN